MVGTHNEPPQSKPNDVVHAPQLHEPPNLNGGDYIRLLATTSGEIPPENPNPRRMLFGYRKSKWFWVNVIAICVLLSVVGVVVVKHFGPFLINKEVIPMIDWLTKTFSPPVLAAIVFGALALFPTLILPTTPFKWVAGMTFGYGIGFLLISSAYAIGVSLPYLIGHYLFLQKIKTWLDKHPRHAAIVRLAGDGDWFHQFRAIVLIRVAPFPFFIFNYTAAATGVKFSPYLAGSLVGLAPDIFVAIYSGILIRTVAEAIADHTPVSKLQMILDGIGFFLTVAATVIIGIYAKRKLEQLHEQEEQQQLVQPAV